MSTSQQISSRTFATVPELIALHSRERPDRHALAQDGQVLTYAELDQLTGRFAATLQHMGVAERSPVAIVSATTLASTVAYLGALRAGCIPAPLAPSSTPAQIAAMVADCGATIVFADAEAMATMPAIAARLMALEDMDHWLAACATDREVQISASDPFNLIYSSGTTGTPKGIIHTHGMRWTQIVAYSSSGAGESVTMITTPLYSNTTLISLLPTLAYGGKAVLMRKFEARAFLALSEQERATHVMLVPVQYQRIMALPDFDTYDLSSYLLKFCTSAPFAAALKADVVRRWPGMLVEIYGMTEGGGSCVLMANFFPHKLHTVGTPVPGCEIRLIDEQGREVACGEIGEVVGRSGVMMQGYHGRPDATSAATWTDAEGKTFFRHGDLGRFDDDGFLTLLGRSKDMIISGGFNIYPQDIESIVLEHPAIADCAVIGVPSAAWGETPYAFYVTRSDDITPAELLEWVNARVGKTQRLSGAEPISELPRSALGKVLKRELRAPSGELT